VSKRHITYTVFAGLLILALKQRVLTADDVASNAGVDAFLAAL